jgi:hypothetical protein
MPGITGKNTGCVSPTCTRCGSPLRIGRGEVSRERLNLTGEVIVTWRWRCGCGRVRTLKRPEGIR